MTIDLRISRSIGAALLFLVVLVFVPCTAVAGTKLLRFPAIHGDKVAFTYAGDIWTAPIAGGIAIVDTSESRINFQVGEPSGPATAAITPVSSHKENN